MIAHLHSKLICSYYDVNVMPLQRSLHYFTSYLACGNVYWSSRRRCVTFPQNSPSSTSDDVIRWLMCWR